MEIKYKNHILLSEFGEKNQKLIQNCKILIVGIGGIGCQVLTQLALNGFENIGICDYDIVSFSNLHRQFIYTLEDAEQEREKITCAEKYILERNKINITKHSLKITNKNIKNIIESYTIIIDCTDNIYTRYIINDACVIYKKVYVFASAIQTSCQLSIFDLSKERNIKLPCLRCIFPAIENQSCENEGVLGTIPNLIGLLTANEVIKYICNYDDLYVGKLLTYNINSGFYTININEANPKCLVCSNLKIINIDNFSQLSIYEAVCKYDSQKYGITKEKIKELDENFNLVNDIIFLDEKLSLQEYENIYSKQLDDLLVFDCENKIRSKILTSKLREKSIPSNILSLKIYYLI